MSKQRRHERFAVRLRVSFATALDFVVEYADNLSAGGLFVRGAHALEPLQEVEVDLELPGYQTFRVIARVAHVLGPAMAASAGMKPGAGVEIVRSPEGFDTALTEYLRRLGRRRDVMVLAPLGSAHELLQQAGYNVAPLPMPSELLAATSGQEPPVIGVVVPRSQADDYRSVMDEAGIGDLLHLFDYEEEVDDLLRGLDELL